MSSVNTVKIGVDKINSLERNVLGIAERQKLFRLACVKNGVFNGIALFGDVIKLLFSPVKIPFARKRKSFFYILINKIIVNSDSH